MEQRCIDELIEMGAWKVERRRECKWEKNELKPRVSIYRVMKDKIYFFTSFLKKFRAQPIRTTHFLFKLKTWTNQKSPPCYGSHVLTMVGTDWPEQSVLLQATYATTSAARGGTDSATIETDPGWAVLEVALLLSKIVFRPYEEENILAHRLIISVRPSYSM
jgi:hypothetical protein